MEDRPEVLNEALRSLTSARAGTLDALALASPGG